MKTVMISFGISTGFFVAIIFVYSLVCSCPDVPVDTVATETDLFSIDDFKEYINNGIGRDNSYFMKLINKEFELVAELTGVETNRNVYYINWKTDGIDSREYRCWFFLSNDDKNESSLNKNIKIKFKVNGYQFQPDGRCIIECEKSGRK